MSELFDNLGFIRAPFTTTTAEAEQNFINKLFVKPRYFGSLLQDLQESCTRFVFGKRGIGKSALMYNIKREAEEAGSLVALITDYSQFDATNNEDQFLNKIIVETIKKLSIEIATSKTKVKGLDKKDREVLLFFVENFLPTLTDEENEALADQIRKQKAKKFWVQLYNIFASLFNTGVSVGTVVLSDVVRKSLNVDAMPTTPVYKEYLEIRPRFKKNVKTVEQVNKNLCELLNELSRVIVKLGYKNLITLFDRTDEYQLLEGNVDKVASFVRDISKDTNLLYSQNIAFAFFLWDELKTKMKGYDVRFDKFKSIDISWEDAEMSGIIDKRMSFFSKNGKNITFKSLIPNLDLRHQIIGLAYRSPRDLLMELSMIYDEQMSVSSSVDFLQENEINMGIKKFVKDYNFSLLYSTSKKGAQSVDNAIKIIRMVGKTKFETSDVIRVKKVSSGQASNDIKMMRNYGLIVEIDNPGNKQRKKYAVKDPKVIYMLRNFPIEPDKVEDGYAY